MAASARPYWTGFLKLSLVTIAVRLYTATTERERIQFHQIHGPTGERVRHQTVVPGVGPVDRDEIVKGYEYEKGRYITIEPDDLKKLRLETTDTIDIVQFADDIDPIYFASPYYLVPDGSVAEEGYRVIREALRKTGKIAVGRVVIGGRERVVAIRPLGAGLLGTALLFEDEVRQPEAYFNTIAEDEVDDDQLAIMEQIIDRKTRAFDAGKFVDHYQAAVKGLVAKKLEGKLPERPTERPTAQVINLMDALKRSLAEEGKEAEAEGEEPRPARKTAAAGKRSAKAAAGAATSKQRDLLLPVAGGRAKPARPAAAAAAKETAEKEAEAPRRRKKA